MIDKNFKIEYWLHSNSETGDFLEFELFSVNGELSIVTIDHLKDKDTMYDEILNNCLDKERYLDKVLISECNLYYQDERKQEDTWLEILNVKEQLGE